MMLYGYHLKLSDYIGFLGAAIVVSQYFLSILGRVKTEGLYYPTINLCGCIFIMVSLCFNFNPPSFLIEIFWSAVSIYGIVRSLQARAHDSTTEKVGQ